MKFSTRLATVGVTALAAVALLAGPAEARGSHSGSHSYSSHTSTSHSYSSGSVGGGGSSTSRGTTGGSTTTRTGGGYTSGSTSKTTVRPPTNVGSNAQRGSTSYTRTAPTRPIPVTRSTTVSGSSFTAPGTSYTYHYHSTSYYAGYHGGYPLFGSSAYWTLWNDPYYMPNYSMFGNPWYHHSYPSGYLVTDGQLIPVHHSHVGLVVTILVIGLVLLVVILVLRRRKQQRAEQSFASRF